MTGVETSRAVAQLIMRDEIPAYLARSVLTKQPVVHATTPRNFDRILREGLELQRGGQQALGRAIYTADKPAAAKYYGGEHLWLAVPNEKPFHIPWMLTNSDSLYLWRVSRATDVPVRELRAAGGRNARLEAARQALLGAGFDSTYTHTPWPERSLWIAAIDPNKIRIVGTSQVLEGLEALHPSALAARAA